MGYSVTLLIPSMLLLPFIAAGAAVAYLALARLRLTPASVPGLISYALIGCMGYGALFLYVTVDLVVLAPWRLQEQGLGRAYGTPFSLRYFDQSGFQDPGSDWRYALSPQDAASLSSRCRSSYKERSSLFSEGDDRRYAFIELEGNTLFVAKGLW